MSGRRTVRSRGCYTRETDDAHSAHAIAYGCAHRFEFI